MRALVLLGLLAFVESQRVASVTVRPAAMTLEVGDVARLTCEPRNPAGTILANPCVWTSSAAALATLTPGAQTARITARKPGKLMVIAAVKGKKDTTRITVLATMPDSITPADSVVACEGVQVAAGASIQAAVNAAGVGDTFCLDGIYRMQQVSPKTDQAFIGIPGQTTLTGGRMITAWQSDGQGHWYAEGQGQAVGPSGVTCKPGYPRCNFPEQLLVDSVLYTPDTSLATLGPGRFYLDYADSLLYVSENLTGHVVEASVTGRAFFNNNATGVTIKNLAVQMYSTPGQGLGTIEGGAGWTLDSVLGRWNHGAPVRTFHRWQILRSKMLANGQYGITGRGDSILVAENEIAYNNSAGIRPGYGAGATKFANTRWAIIRDNHVHHNYGNGIWTDVDNEVPIITGNLVEWQDGQGIFQEIGWGGRISFNIVRHSGQAPTDNFQSGAGIIVSASPDVEVDNNIVEDNVYGIIALQQARGSGTYGLHLVKNLNVHHNTVKLTGVAQHGFKGGYTAANTNNWFRDNTYTLTAGSAVKYFVLGGGNKTLAEWQAAGQQ